MFSACYAGDKYEYVLCYTDHDYPNEMQQYIYLIKNNMNIHNFIGGLYDWSAL